MHFALWTYTNIYINGPSFLKDLQRMKTYNESCTLNSLDNVKDMIDTGCPRKNTLIKFSAAALMGWEQRSMRSSRCAGRSALTPLPTRSWATGLPTSLPLMRVFKFHANSRGVKQTLEPKGHPRIREPKENLNFFPLWICQMEGTFSCLSCLR